MAIASSEIANRKLKCMSPFPFCTYLAGRQGRRYGVAQVSKNRGATLNLLAGRYRMRRMVLDSVSTASNAAVTIRR